MEYFMTNGTRKSIDFDYVLDKINVVTPYGIDCKKNLKPFMPSEESNLRDELNRIDILINLINEHSSCFAQLKELLLHVKDLRNSIKKCVEGYTLTLVELYEIKNFILLLKDIQQKLNQLNWKIPEDLKIERIPAVEKLLDPQGAEIKTFYIYDEYSQELRDIRVNKKIIEKEIAAEKKRIRERVKEELNINIRPDGEVTVFKAEDKLIERIEKSPYFRYNSETYMNIKYCIKPTPILDKLVKEMELLKQREDEEEFKVRTKLSKEIGSYSEKIINNMEAIGKLDLTLAKAYMAIEMRGVKPIITNEHVIDIVDGRHIKVEENLKEIGKGYVPISLKVRQGVTCITGANMGGKTVTLKMVGLLAAMAQYGLFVPCVSMETGLNEFIYISIGDFQSIDKGLSTFGGEIRGIQEVISKKEKKGLVLIDELARGTNPEEGYAISKAVINYLKDGKCITIITTHYDNIANTDGVVHLQVVGLSNVDFDRLRNEIGEDSQNGMDVINKYMDYRLVKISDKSEVPRDAINIARLMGLEEEILKDAEEILTFRNK